MSHPYDLIPLPGPVPQVPHCTTVTATRGIAPADHRSICQDGSEGKPRCGDVLHISQLVLDIIGISTVPRGHRG